MTIKEKNQLIKDLKAHGKKIASSKTLAKKELQKAGIITKSGKLNENYK